MRMRSLCLTAALAGAALLSSWALSEEGKEKPKAEIPKEQQEMMEKWMAAALPGPHHEHLKALAGHWKQEVKMWPDPASPPSVSEGVGDVKWIMGGRYLQEDVQGTMMEGPFNGMGITGYDNVQKKYVSSWIDSMGTGIMTSTGTCDGAGKVFNWTGEYFDAVSGKKETYRMVTRVVDDTKHVFEMWSKNPQSQGKEFKMMEITYTRM